MATQSIPARQKTRIAKLAEQSLMQIAILMAVQDDPPSAERSRVQAAAIKRLNRLFDQLTPKVTLH